MIYTNTTSVEDNYDDTALWSALGDKASISTLSSYAPKASPTFTGTVTLPQFKISSSSAIGYIYSSSMTYFPSSDNYLATTKLIDKYYAPKESPTFTGTLTLGDKTISGVAAASDTSPADNDVVTAGYLNANLPASPDLSIYAPLASPTFTGTLITPELKIGSSSSSPITKLATSLLSGITSFINDATLPIALPTAGYINKFYAPKTSPTFTGTVILPNLRFGIVGAPVSGVAISSTDKSTANTTLTTAGYVDNYYAPKASPTFTGKTLCASLELGSVNAYPSVDRVATNISAGATGYIDSINEILTSRALNNRPWYLANNGSNNNNGVRISMFKLGDTATSTYANKILTSTDASSTSDNELITAGYLNANLPVSPDLSTYAPIDSPTFTGTATIPTLAIGTNTTDNILIDTSTNSTLNTDIVSAGYLNKELKNKATNYLNEPTAWKESNLSSTATWYSVVYGNNKFVTVAYNSDKAAYSTDGITWIETTLPYSVNWYSVTYGNNKFVAVADSSDKAAYSTDGITWVASTLSSSASWLSVTYGNNKFIAVAANSDKVAYSTDGITWTASTLPSTASWRSVTYGNNRFVAIATSSDKAAYSTDGITWTDSTLPSSATRRSVVYGNNKFVTVAYNSDKAAYSTDGITWTASTLPSNSYWQSITYGNNKFVAVTTSSNVSAYSTDGITWTASTLPSSAAWRSIVYGNNKFVTVADNSNIAAYSSGITELKDFNEIVYAPKTDPTFTGTVTLGTKTISGVAAASDTTPADNDIVTAGYLNTKIKYNEYEIVPSFEIWKRNATSNTTILYFPNSNVNCSILRRYEAWDCGLIEMHLEIDLFTYPTSDKYYICFDSFRQGPDGEYKSFIPYQTGTVYATTADGIGTISSLSDAESEAMNGTDNTLKIHKANVSSVSFVLCEDTASTRGSKILYNNTAGTALFDGGRRYRLSISNIRV